MKVKRILAAECRLPLPRPIRLGPVEIQTRDYVVLRLETSSGLVGDAIGYPRGTPLLETLARIGPRFIGTDISMRRQSVEQFLSSMVNARPVFMRAISLFDMALWDLAAKTARLPLFRLLGGCRKRVPVMAVGGYYLEERGIDEVRDEIASLLDRGFSRVKIMLSGRDAAFDQRYVDRVQQVAEGKLGVDAHWSWQSIPQALRTCSLIDDAGLLFLEDPFGAYQWPLTLELQARLKMPVTCGEDMPDAVSLFSLTQNLSLIRVDATTCGGISAAMDVMSAASLCGCGVLPHVFAPLHAQLAGAYAAIEMVEHVPEETGADPLNVLLARAPRITDGELWIDEEPGAGIDLNWNEIQKCSINSVDIDGS